MAYLDPTAGLTGTAYVGRGQNAPDPFDDLASQVMPRTMPDALRWAQSVHMLDGTYAQAMRRVASYFVTDVQVQPPSSRGEKKVTREEKQKWDTVLKKTLKLASQANSVAYDYLVYGVSFTSVRVPFIRHLSCRTPRCGFMAPLEQIGTTSSYGFQWVNFEFTATCPSCKKTGVWRHDDLPGDAEAGAKIRRWNPHEMEIIDDISSDEQAFIWKIPEHYRRLLSGGAGKASLFHLCRANWETIQAVKRRENILLKPGLIHYMKDPALAGVYTAGWGLSRAVVNFRQAWHNQVLRRFNEAICQEFIVPFRVLSPDSKGGTDPGSTDPVFGGGGGAMFSAQMRSMIRKHRRDPSQIQISPFPINFQMLGGEAEKLAPFQLIDQAMDSMLNASGVPAELYKGTLQMQAAPAALRLFESHWAHLVDALNSWVDFVVDRMAKICNWEPIDARFMRPRTADDISRQMALLQLMTSRNISQHTGLSSLDLDFEDEQDQLIEEQTYVDEKTKEVQDEAKAKSDQQALPAQSAQQSQGQPQGQQQGGQQGQGAPPPGPPPSSGPPQVEELLAKSDEIAKRLLEMSESQRHSELIELKKSDTALHALVKSRVDARRQDTKTAGGAQAMASQYGGQQQ